MLIIYCWDDARQAALSACCSCHSMAMSACAATLTRYRDVRDTTHHSIEVHHCCKESTAKSHVCIIGATAMEKLLPLGISSTTAQGLCINKRRQPMHPINSVYKKHSTQDIACTYHQLLCMSPLILEALSSTVHGLHHRGTRSPHYHSAPVGPARGWWGQQQGRPQRCVVGGAGWAPH